MPNSRAKLLIVDDEASTRALLRHIFTGLGHQVRVAQDGFSALEEIRSEVPDVLLSDLNMPCMSGFELLSVVRRKLPKIYVIATSGAFSGEEVPRGIAADAFHEKATGLGKLFEKVNSATAEPPRREPSIPIWISHFRSDNGEATRVLISCPECMRAFPLPVGAADFTIRETACVYCKTSIRYATVQPMNAEAPHHFHDERRGSEQRV